MKENEFTEEMPMQLVLDGMEIYTKEELHASISEQLRLPDWYGANLDALYDVLTERVHPVEIQIKRADWLQKKLGQYYDAFMETLTDAVRQSSYLTLDVQKACVPPQNLTAIRLSASELEELYENDLKRDFPPEERKPLKVLLQLTEEGKYESYGWYDTEDNMVAYTLFVTLPENHIVSLDYLAVRPQYRDKKYGSAILAQCRYLFADWDGMIAEAEDPDAECTPEEKQTRTRRVSFYQKKNGMYLTNIRTVQFGVPYVLLYLPSQMDAPEPSYAEQTRMMEDMNRIYHASFQGPLYDRYIRVWQEPQVDAQ